MRVSLKLLNLELEPQSPQIIPKSDVRLLKGMEYLFPISLEMITLQSLEQRRGERTLQRAVRIAGHTPGRPLADGETICGAVLAPRIEARCGPISTGLGPFISFRVRVPRAASMDGPLCCAMYGTSGWIKSPSLVALDHFVPHHREVVITEVEMHSVVFPWLRTVAVKGKLSHQGQYNSTVSLAVYVLDLSGRCDDGS